MFRARRLAALVFDRPARAPISSPHSPPDRRKSSRSDSLGFFEVSLEFWDGTPVYRELAKPRTSSFHHPNPAIRVLVFGSCTKEKTNNGFRWFARRGSPSMQKTL